VGWETVHDRRIGGVLEEVRTDLEAREVVHPDVAFVLLAHADPDVRIDDDIGVGDRLNGIGRGRRIAAEFAGPLEDGVVDLVPLGRRDCQIDVRQRTAERERLGDVVAVTDPGRRDILEAVCVLADRQQIRERLTRVSVIRESVGRSEPRSTPRALRCFRV